MQVEFYLAGYITQVLYAIPWVRCASGNVSLFLPKNVQIFRRTNRISGKESSYWLSSWVTRAQRTKSSRPKGPKAGPNYRPLVLLYGSYKHVPISYDHFLTAAGYYRKWWSINKIDYNFHHWSWYMGHTSKWQFHTGLGRFLTAAGNYRKWWSINKIDYNFHHWVWYMGHTSKWQFGVQWTTIFWQL